MRIGTHRCASLVPAGAGQRDRGVPAEGARRALGAAAGGAVAGHSAIVLLLAGVTPADPLTLCGVALLCLTKALVGCLQPAPKAMRVATLQVLRAE
jgi:hypothetical protein